MQDNKKKTAPKRKRVTFTYKAKEGSKVFVAGSFNEWDPVCRPMKYNKTEKCYKTSMLLEKGSYQYKFCVDGEWRIDPENPNFINNNHGTLNSVIEVV